MCGGLEGQLRPGIFRCSCFYKAAAAPSVLLDSMSPGLKVGFLLLFTSLLSLRGTFGCKNLKLKFDVRKIMEPKTCTGLPRIEGDMGNFTAQLGEKVLFHCQVDHSCMVSSIKWFHATHENGTLTLIKTAKDPGDPHVHQIRSVGTEDAGSYHCVAENVLGQAEMVAFLQVSSSPKVNPSSDLLLLLVICAGLLLLVQQRN